MTEFSVYTDGASRGNPGPSAISYAMYDFTGNLIEKGAKCIGKHTNSEAEYEALLWAIEKVRERTCDHLKLFSDSEFMVRQINGEYKASNERMKKYLARTLANKELFTTFEVRHVPRDNPRMQLVDHLANEALDREFPR
ncbi:MAG: ribonuclease HI family protein [Candidatus Thermoplasmatota archaeon]|nr:ribonuclease HI family protein [Candidatus Thermoplasmatota archaeon]